MATDTAAAATPTTISVSVTSNLSQPATIMSAKNTTEYLVRFPPFPESPAGVKVIPFKDFKEKGIRVQAGGDDNETEVDAWGVPTMALANIHSTDWCKSETRRAKFNNNGTGPGRKRRKRKTGGGINSGPTAADWEEYWEDREASFRVSGSYDPHATAYERFCLGAWDFKNLRPWPLAQKQSGPVFVWGEFSRFAGIPLVQDPTSTAKTEEPSTKPKTDEDEDSELDSEEEDGDPMAGILNPQHLASMEATMKAQVRGEAFLADPAGMLKVFFSSYARDRGIIWTDANLTGAPILLRFFTKFLIDNKVLPDREENAIKHESTRRIIEDALKELPLTSKLSKVWPDEFHKACKSGWGSKAEVFVFTDIPPMEEDVTENDKGEEGTTAGADAQEGWANMATESGPTFAGGGEGWGGGGWGDAAAEDPGLAEGNAVEDWNAGEAWNVVGDEIAGEEENTAPTTFSLEVNNDEQSWDVFKPPSFFPLLGPTALPITHTPGIVESSLRRIKAVFPPSPDVSKFPVAKDVSAEAVEGVLRRTFGVVVFEPWVNWNNGEEPHLSMPKILASSRGSVIKVETADGSGAKPADPDTPAPTALPPFDPYKDVISVLVDSAYLDLFSVGMGCLCTWVQIARVEDFEPQDPKKKKKKNAKIERLWYIEEALRVVPSYYTYLG